MDEATRTSGTSIDDGQRDPAEIRADIDKSREELGETVEALAAKTDVKAQAQARVEGVKEQARAKVESVKERVGSSGSDGDAADGSSSLNQAVEQARATASANPVQTAAAAAFTAGIAIGLILGRR